MDEKIHGPAYRIHTPRLVLRCWDPADAVLIQDALVSSIVHLMRCNPANVYSAAIPRRLRFTHEGTLRKNYALRGDFKDTMIWSLLDDEYPSSPSASIEIKAFDAIGRQLL